MFTLNMLYIGQSSYCTICPFNRLSSTWVACSITLLKTDSIRHARFHFSQKCRIVPLNFDKFLCPFMSNPRGFYVHSFFLTVVISWGREVCPCIRGSTLTFSHKSSWLSSELYCIDIANAHLKVSYIYYTTLPCFHRNNETLSWYDLLFNKKKHIAMHTDKIL